MTLRSNHQFRMAIGWKAIQAKVVITTSMYYCYAILGFTPKFIDKVIIFTFIFVFIFFFFSVYSI
jgi:hypothetical protein